MIETEIHVKVPLGFVQPGLAPYTIAVGALCNYWARLESHARTLFAAAARMPFDDTTYAIIHCLPFNDQLTAIKVAFVKNAKEPRLVGPVIEAINYIDNTLRPRRNRHVHDSWFYNDWDELALKYDSTVRISKTQSRKPLEVKAGSITQESLEDLWSTMLEIKQHADFLYDVQDCILGNADKIEVLLKSQLQRRFLPAQQGKPGPSGNIPKGPEPRPESSAE